MPSMSGGRFIAETLYGYGVTSVFFVPSILKPTLVELEKLGVRRVLCHSEKAAAYMADGYARASQKPGIAFAQSVGAANLAAALQDPWLAQSPVIALTGQRAAIDRYRHAYQEIDHWPLYEPVTKFNGRVDAVQDLPVLLRQAFREATCAPTGPVHLDVLGLQGEGIDEAEANLEVIVEDTFKRVPAFRPEPQADQVRAAAARLQRAQRPVLVAGEGAAVSGAGPEILRLAEKLSMPVAYSLDAKGIIPDDHPLCVGAVGTYSRKCANQVVHAADLVLFVGSWTGSMVTNFWQVPPAGTPTIQINQSPVELGRNYPAEVALAADPKVALQHLDNALAAPEPRQEWAQRARQLVDEWRSELAPHASSDAIPIRPERLCREVSECLPTDAVLVSDTGHAGMWTGASLDLKHPGQTYMRAAGSLGWAFPAALGARCALPERPVVCFTGDGGFWYHLCELETALRSGIKTVTVINNNRSLNQDREGVERAYAGQTAGDKEEIWVFRDVDMAEVARSMGCCGIRVERPGDLQSALEQALASDLPAVVDVASDIDVVAPVAYVPE
jgi:acetolactate synthase I/II/III large subunit